MRKRTLALLVSIGLLLALGAALLPTTLAPLGALTIAAVVTLLLLWGMVAFFRRFLWRVGRKLAFSYFLIGILPIPMVIGLFGLVGWVFFGALLGHTFRDSLVDLHQDLEIEIAPLLMALEKHDNPPSPLSPDLRVALYRNGRLVGGDLEGAPDKLPVWLLPTDFEVDPDGMPRVDEAHELPFVRYGEGPARLAVVAEREDLAAVAVFVGDLAAALRDRTGSWVRFESTEDGPGNVELQLPGKTRVVLGSGPEPLPVDRKGFFGVDDTTPWLDRPIVYWGEILSPARSLAEPEFVGERQAAVLNSSLRLIYERVVYSDTELDSAAWGSLLVVAFLLFDVYVVASLMAIYMIVGLSLSVNRLSRATSAVQGGDFSVRIPVQRKDQLGEMQRSFNQMAASLEELVTAAAQKESLEKELQIARELQQNLLPSALTTTEAVEFASFFEPSAAIGGDYFDLLRQEDGRLAVVVADVSGHGLSAGLRMAMLKAALVMLAEQQLPPHEILTRLDAMVRRERTPGKGRPMVTATLSVFDSRSGALEIVNAGHTPTYLVRDGEVEEILLPSPPLGALGHDYASREMRLEPGDLMVWLSDGLVEAVDAEDRAFGYERVESSLRGRSGSATELRDRLLLDVAEFTGRRPATDDRTLVVMRYLPRVDGAAPDEASLPTGSLAPLQA